MKNNVIVNELIYKNYKDEVIDLNPRLFTTPYFYSLNTYTTPIDLSGMEHYLKYSEEVIIYATSSFIDFVNILLVLSYLKANNYTKNVTVNYYLSRTNKLDKDLLISKTLNSQDYLDVNDILMSLKENKKITSKGNYLAGMLNYVSFFNTLADSDLLFSIIEDELEDEYDYNNAVQYLVDKYANMGINKEYFEGYVSKHLDN